MAKFKMTWIKKENDYQIYELSKNGRIIDTGLYPALSEVVEQEMRDGDTYQEDHTGNSGRITEMLDYKYMVDSWEKTRRQDLGL